MKRNRFSFTPKLLPNSLLAVLMVTGTTVLLVLFGRDTLGEAVIALLYLVPVAWSANKWGQLPGISAALTAALAFDFLFIPPFYTFAVARLEGWLVLAIFLGVAILVVGRIQDSLSKAHEAVFMYELSSALTGLRTQEAVAHTVAKQLRQLFQASLVNVIFYPENRSLSIVASEPSDGLGKDRPDRVLPLLNSWGLVGEIQIWRGAIVDLPSDDSRLLQNFASQTARALERTQQAESEKYINGLTLKASTK
jgi:two-component system sensor histidine kinase KdpD